MSKQLHVLNFTHIYTSSTMFYQGAALVLQLLDKGVASEALDVLSWRCAKSQVVQHTSMKGPTSKSNFQMASCSILISQSQDHSRLNVFCRIKATSKVLLDCVSLGFESKKSISRLSSTRGTKGNWYSTCLPFSPPRFFLSKFMQFKSSTSWEVSFTPGSSEGSEKY